MKNKIVNTIIICLIFISGKSYCQDSCTCYKSASYKIFSGNKSTVVKSEISICYDRENFALNWPKKSSVMFGHSITKIDTIEDGAIRYSFRDVGDRCNMPSSSAYVSITEEKQKCKIGVSFSNGKMYYFETKKSYKQYGYGSKSFIRVY